MLDERLRRLAESEAGREPDDATLSRVLRRGRRLRTTRILGRVVALMIVGGVVAGVFVGIRHLSVDNKVPVTRSPGYKPATCRGFGGSIDIDSVALSSDAGVVAFSATPFDSDGAGAHLIVACGKGRPTVHRARINPTCVLNDGEIVSDRPASLNGGGICFGPDEPTVALTPDGRTAYFDATGSIVPGPRNAGSNVYAMDVATGRVTRVTDPPGVSGVDDIEPRVSADGRALTYIRRAVHVPHPGDDGRIERLVRVDLRTGAMTSTIMGVDQQATSAYVTVGNPTPSRFALSVSTSGIDELDYARDPARVASGRLVFHDRETGTVWSFALPKQDPGTTSIDVSAAIAPDGRSILLLLSTSGFAPLPDGRLAVPASQYHGFGPEEVSDAKTGQAYVVGSHTYATPVYLATPRTHSIRAVRSPKGNMFVGRWPLGIVVSPDGSVVALQGAVNSTIPRRYGEDLLLFDLKTGLFHRVTWHPHWWIAHERLVVWTLIILVSLWVMWAWGSLPMGARKPDARRFNLAVLIVGTAVLAWVALLHGWPGWPLVAFAIAAAITEAFAPHPRPFRFWRARRHTPLIDT